MTWKFMFIKIHALIDMQLIIKIKHLGPSNLNSLYGEWIIFLY